MLIVKVVTKYISISTKHILYKYGLGQPKYLQLALQFDELIRELYNDPIILKRHTGEIKSFPGKCYHYIYVFIYNHFN